MPRVQIEGIQAAQAAVNRVVASTRPAGALGAAVQEATVRLHRYAVGVTHVDTGALRGSHTMRITRTRGEIYISPNARHATGKRPAEYGVYEHRRGGSHAFYARTVAEHGQAALRTAGDAVRRALP